MSRFALLRSMVGDAKGKGVSGKRQEVKVAGNSFCVYSQLLPLIREKFRRAAI